MLKRPRRTIGYRIKLIALAGLILVAGAYLGHWYAKPDLSKLNAYLLQEPVTLSHFELTDIHQQTFNEQSFKGRWNLVFLGYTSCPDICPTTLTRMAQVSNRLAHKPSLQRNIRFIFVSVDPARDTLNVLRSYVTYFNPNFTAMTGNDKELRKLAKQLDIPYELEVKDQQGNYDVNHGANIAIINGDGQYIGVINPVQPAQSIADDIMLLEHNRKWKNAL